MMEGKEILTPSRYYTFCKATLCDHTRDQVQDNSQSQKLQIYISEKERISLPRYPTLIIPLFNYAMFNYAMLKA